MENPNTLTDQQIDNWFNNSEWLESWPIKPHSSINKRRLAKAIYNHPKRWLKAFQFLNKTDLTTLEEGKIKIEGQNVFYAVAQYTTKNREDAEFEAHKSYIDIQYVIKGEELIGVCQAEELPVSKPYNSQKDIVFYNHKGGDFHKADPSDFFIFFPEEAHCPAVKLSANSEVKKLVVKIKIN